MSTHALRAEIYDFLNRHFPGSTLDDGYFFARIEAPVVRNVHSDKLGEVFDKLVDAPSWLVTVNNDPTGLIDARRIEQGLTSYTPDWNYNEDVPQWFVELPARPRVDLQSLRRSMKPLGALILVSPTHRLIYDLHYMRLYAASNEELERFAGNNSALFGDEA